jgi:hypothetical protein
MREGTASMRLLVVSVLLLAVMSVASAIPDCEYFSLEEWELSLAVVPVWVGPADTLYGYYNDEVYTSIDRGDFWASIHQFDGSDGCRGLFVDSRSTVFVDRKSTGKLQMGRFDGGLARTWSEPLDFVCGSGFWKMDEDVHGNLFIGEYAGVWEDTCAYIHRSMDGGVTWEVVYEGTGRHVHFVAADPYTGSVYAAIGDGVARAKLLRSDDQGDTWNTIYQGDFRAQPISIAFTEGYRIFGSDSGGTLNLWNSVYRTSNDQLFVDQLILYGEDNAFVWSLVKNVQDVLYAGTLSRDDGDDRVGIFVSHDDGRHWCRAKDFGVVATGYTGVNWMSNFDAAGYGYYHENVEHKTYRFRDGPWEPVAVEGSFYAEIVAEGTVTLRWTVGSLAGVEGFNVYRATSPDGPFERLTETPLPPTSPGVFQDLDVWPESTFWYELRVVWSDGAEEPVGTELPSVTTGGRLRAQLSAPFPNPFSELTNVEFDVPNHIGPVRLAIYDLRGRVVRTLISGALGRGRYPAAWDGTDERGRPVPSGVYFVRLDVGDDAQAKKLLLVK